MTFREMVLATSPFKERTEEQNYIMGSMGLSGEAGEVTDLLKNVIFHKKPFDKEDLKKEISDVLWYAEYLMLTVGTTREEVEQIGMTKLLKRYPNGFSPEAAAARADENK